MIGVKEYASDQEEQARSDMHYLLNEHLIPDDQVLSNLGLFLTSKNLSRILFLNYIYQQIVDIHGVVMDFGTRWGQNLAVFAALRGIYEPFNRHRKLIGFDTFSGFPNISAKDGLSDLMQKGNISVTDHYQRHLEEIMKCQEDNNPLSHIKKFEIIAGDACKTLQSYLSINPHSIVALAYFDFDLYEPTKVCLDLIKDRLVKGSVLCFDELNDPDSPGETLAVMEALGLNNIRLQRWKHVSRISYAVFE
jgi:hypothetical protein|tara:strand:+ start:5499 stop:6245 length:747 start_codon:yes stop_codon:yes gene_type:complete